MSQANARGLGLLGVEWPEGEPDGLAEGATRIAGEAESLDGLARSVVDVALSSGGWSGSAAYAMRQEAQARAGVVRMAATPLMTVSSVLLQYAGILDGVQSELTEMADRAVELERAIDAAHEAARVARAAAASASQRAQQAAASDDPITAGACRLAASAELGAAQVADGAAEQAQEELERLRRRAARLVARERRASRQSAALIEAAEVPVYDASMLPAALSAGGEVMRVAIEDARRRAAQDDKKSTGLLHGLLDAIGTVDPTPLTDGINAGIYLDRTGAALSVDRRLPLGRPACGPTSATPRGSTGTVVTHLPDGSVRVAADVPARNVPGSYARYEKTIAADGRTTGYTKTTYAPDGTVVHIKDKLHE